MVRRMDWRRIALRDMANAKKAASIAAGDYPDQNCPYTGCIGVINVSRQILMTGGEVFVCQECDRRSFMDIKGQLATEEEYGRAHDAMCET